jgi:hypothetical protein
MFRKLGNGHGPFDQGIQDLQPGLGRERPAYQGRALWIGQVKLKVFLDMVVAFDQALRSLSHPEASFRGCMLQLFRMH